MDIEQKDTGMTGPQKFTIGAFGGLLPVLVSLLSADIAGIVDGKVPISLGICVGNCIQVLVLLVLGGALAAFNTEISKPWTLVQLGIAAPALISGLISARSPSLNPASPSLNRASLSIIPAARADDILNQPRQTVLAGGFLNDVIQGIISPLASPPVTSDATNSLQRQPSVISPAEIESGWSVVVGSTKTRADGEKVRDKINEKFPHRYSVLVRRSLNTDYWAVTVGEVSLSLSDALSLQKQAVADGLAKDAYLKRSKDLQPNS